MLTVSYSHAYPKNGGITHVYGIISTLEKSDAAKAKKELDDFKKAKGDNFREGTEAKNKASYKRPLFFSTQVVPDGTPLAAKMDGSDYYLQTDLKETALAQQETAEAIKGKLEGIRQYSGMSRKTFTENLLKQVLS